MFTPSPQYSYRNIRLDPIHIICDSRVDPWVEQRICIKIMMMEVQQKLMTLLTMVRERAKDVFACKTRCSTAKPIRDNTNHSWGGKQFEKTVLYPILISCKNHKSKDGWWWHDDFWSTTHSIFHPPSPPEVPHCLPGSCPFLAGFDKLSLLLNMFCLFI